VSTEIIIALLGIASTIVSWALGRKRTNAEVAAMQMDYIKSADTFYRERIDNLQKEVAEQAKQIRALRLIIDKVIDNACLVQKCPKRKYYNPDILAEIMNEEGVTFSKVHEVKAG
jgi:hypothetical protein